MAQAEAVSQHPSLDLLRRVFNHAALLSDDSKITALYRDASSQLGTLALQAKNGEITAATFGEAWAAASTPLTQVNIFSAAGSPRVTDIWLQVSKVVAAFGDDAEQELHRLHTTATHGKQARDGIQGFMNLMTAQADSMGASGAPVRETIQRLQALLAATAQGSHGETADGKPAGTVQKAFASAMSPFHGAYMDSALSGNDSAGIFLQDIAKALSQNGSGIVRKLLQRFEAAQLDIVKGAIKPVYSVTLKSPLSAPQTARFRARPSP